MLVLSRKKNEGFVIGGNVRVVVVDVRGDKVRLGIDAGPDVPVDRDEVHQAKERAKAEARRGLKGGTEGGAR